MREEWLEKVKAAEARFQERLAAETDDERAQREAFAQFSAFVRATSPAMRKMPDWFQTARAEAWMRYVASLQSDEDEDKPPTP